MTDAETTIRAYYAAFNAGDTEAFLDLLTEDVIHDISQGGREAGRARATFALGGVSGQGACCSNGSAR